MSNETPFLVFQCRTCGFIYEEEYGAPDEGLAPGTRWSEVPESWICPSCGTRKADFDMIQL